MARAKILAIDDNSVNLVAIEQALQEEYDIVPMIAGQRAIKYLSAKTADLILLDVRMPGMDGIETLTKIRELENGKTIPVIFLTAMDDALTEQEGKKLGVSDFIIKPFDDQDLKNRIASLL